MSHKDMLQLFEFKRLLLDQMIPSDGKRSGIDRLLRRAIYFFKLLFLRGGSSMPCLRRWTA